LKDAVKQEDPPSLGASPFVTDMPFSLTTCAIEEQNRRTDEDSGARKSERELLD
ncbi:hypothetical protein V5O48_014151, partial [Marasmius crinis-equi]